MIIVTGIGRSGTSVLMDYAKAIRSNVGDISWVHKYEAGNEHPKVSNINAGFRAMWLKGMTGKEKAERLEVLKESIRNLETQSELEVIKDPQFVGMPEILTYWHKALKEKIRIIYCHRDFEDIVESQRRIPEMTAPVYRNHPDLIAAKVTEFRDEVERLKIPMTTISFPDDYHDFNAIEKLNLPTLKRRSQRKAIWSGIWKPGKVHAGI